MKPNEIKAARARLGYNQRDVAIRLGIPASTYSAKENGRVEFSTEQKIALAEIFNWTLKQLNENLFDGKLPIESK